MKYNEEKENKQILNAYRGILRSMKSSRSKNETREIRKAFDVAVQAHKACVENLGNHTFYILLR